MKINIFLAKHLRPFLEGEVYSVLRKTYFCSWSAIVLLAHPAFSEILFAKPSMSENKMKAKWAGVTEAWLLVFESEAALVNAS